MSLFKPKNRAAAEQVAQENAQYFDETLKAFRQKLSSAKELADAGAQFFSLEAIASDIRLCKEALSGKIKNQVAGLPLPPNNKLYTIPIGLGLTGTGGAGIAYFVVALCAAPTVPVVAPLLIFIGGAIVCTGGLFTLGEPRNNFQPERILETVKQNQDVFLYSLDHLLADIDDEKAAIEKNIAALAASPQFAQVCANSPGLKDSFNTAAAYVIKKEFLQKLQGQLAAAQAIDDLGERYLALETFKNQVSAFRKEVHQGTPDQNKIIPDARAVLAAMENPAQKDDICASTEKLLDETSRAQTSILRDGVAELSASPHFYELHKNCADVREAVTIATAKETLSAQLFAKVDKPICKQ